MPSATTQKSHRVYHRGESLFSMGDTFDALYIMRAGSAKSYLSSSNGDEQISGFYHPGDLIGLDGFDNMKYAQSLRFLETSSVCRIGLAEFNRAMGESATMRQRLLKSMSHSLVDEQQLLLSVSKFNAEQRLAKFLLDLSARFEQRGLSGKIFDLSMTRIDIANFLGMAIETISRLLTKLQQQGIVDVNRRQISLLSIDKLRDCLKDEEERSWIFPITSDKSKADMRSLSA
jgi:CRP/FNR family transcriptional regulator